jgi:hypothetical protein
MALAASAPHLVHWRSQWTRDATRLSLLAKWMPTNAVSGLNAALQKPSYGQVGLIRTVLPCHDIALVFHHGLTTQLAKTSTEKFID